MSKVKVVAFVFNCHIPTTWVSLDYLPEALPPPFLWHEAFGFYPLNSSSHISAISFLGTARLLTIGKMTLGCLEGRKLVLILAIFWGCQWFSVNPSRDAF